MTTERAETTLDVLLDFVKRTRGFDFTGYKRSSLERRVAKRMASVGSASYDDYSTTSSCTRRSSGASSTRS